MSTKKLKAIAFIGIFLLSFFGAGFINIVVNQHPVRAATIYYVSSTGNDGNAGTSTETPWKTLGKVNNESKPAGIINGGDSILFKRGDTFTGSYTLRWIKNGTSTSNPTVFDAYGEGTDPIFSGFSSPINRATDDGYNRGKPVNNVTIRNLRFENNSGNHIRFSENSSYIIIEDCFFGNRTGSISMGMVRLANNVHDCVVRNNIFDWFKTDAYEDGVSIVGSNHILVENNTFYGITHSCVMVYGYWSKYDSGGIGYITNELPSFAHPYEYVIIRNNTFNTPRRGGEPYCFQNHTLWENNTINIWPYCDDPTNTSYQILGGSEQIALADYTIHRFETLRGVRDSRAICPYGSGDAAPTTKVALYHLTIYSTERLHVPSSYRYPGSSGYTNQGIICCSNGDGMNDISIFNNIIYCPHPDNYAITSWYGYYESTDFENCTFENNVCCVGDSFSDQKLRISGVNYDISYCEANSPFNKITFDNNIAEVPEMNTTDFSLNASSNCMDAGRHLTTTTTSGTSSYIGVNAEWNLWPRVTIAGVVYPGDIIFVGNDQNLEVLAVYTNHTIKVNRSIYHLVGQSVGFQRFYYDIPDIGANQRAGELYVATTGSDTTGDGSFETPYATIQKAVNVSAFGYDIIVREGAYTYSSSVAIRGNGSASNWYTIRNYTGETVYINGTNVPSGNNLNGAFELFDCNYVRITGLIFNWSAMGGIGVNPDYSDPCDHIRIDNCTIYHCGAYAIKSGTGDTNLEIDYNIIHDNFKNWSATTLSQELISLSNTDGFSIHHNTIYNNPAENIDIKSGSSDGLVYCNNINTTCDYKVTKGSVTYMGGHGIYIDCRGEVNNITINRNFVHGNVSLIVLNSETTSGWYRNITITNNLLISNNPSGGDITSSSRVGIMFDRYGANTNIFRDFVVAYNTIIKASDDAGQLLQVGHYTAVRLHKDNFFNCTIANNILYSPNDIYTFFAIPKINYTDPGCIYIFNNSYYKPSGTYRVNFYGDKTLATPGAWGDDYNTSDPEFRDVSINDYYLNITSPNFNTANTTIIVADDYAGIYRPQGAGYDRGAYEFFPTIPPNPALVETTKIIYHGMSTTPTMVEITPTSYPGGYFAYFIDSVNSTAFTIHLISNTGVTITFNWRARYV